MRLVGYAKVWRNCRKLRSVESAGSVWNSPDYNNQVGFAQFGETVVSDNESSNSHMAGMVTCPVLNSLLKIQPNSAEPADATSVPFRTAKAQRLEANQYTISR